MDAVPLVRASAFIPFFSFLQGIGAPVERRLEDVLLPQRTLEDPETLVPLNQVLLFLDRNAAAEGIEDLGVQTARNTHMPQLGAFGRLICESLTLFDALSKMSRMISLFNSSQRIWLEPWDTRQRLCHRLAENVGCGREFGDQFTLMLMIDCIRLAAGPRWWPAEIHLEESASAKIAGHPGAFGDAVLRRGEVSAIIFDRALLSLPLHYAKSEGTSAHGDYESFKMTAPAENFPDSVKQVVRSFLRDRKFDVGHIAEIAGMSARTFQRRLAEDGMDLTSLVDAARFEASLSLLDDRQAKLTDVAYEVGFAETASFTRAFRRWTGFAPSEFRRLRSELQTKMPD